MSISHLGALVLSKPEEAKALILDALRESGGDRSKAADKLKTTHRSLYRHIERLRMWDEIDALMREQRFPLVPGPPRAADKIKMAIMKSRGSLDKAAKELELKPGELRARIADLGIEDDLRAMLKAAKVPATELDTATAAT
jgi:DNA-binding NtrC family response regulator